MSALDFEEYLDTKKVFVNCFTNQRAHSDSYNTVVDFAYLLLAIQESPFSVKDMIEYAEKEFLTSDIPTLKVVGYYIKKYVK